MPLPPHRGIEARGEVLRNLRRRRAGGDEPLRVRPAGAFRPRDLDPDAVRVVRRLNQHGFAAYLVGGCVRDLLLGVSPKDFDITTEATPRQVKRLFRNSRIIGRRFRLVHITFENKVLDVATFRAEAPPAGASDDPMIRHDNVFGTAAEDARRRDFTINGLFYDVGSDEVIDYVGGLRDLERRTIETIGDPWVRLREDPVRMLRAIKFAGRLHFRLADDVYQAIIDCAADIGKSAAPRLMEEILRILNRGGALASVRLLYKTGLLAELLPEIAGAIDAKAAGGCPSAAWGCLGDVDRSVREGGDVSQAFMLASLFLPLFEDFLYGGPDGAPLPGGDPALVIERTLRPIAGRLHMSRRDAFRVKQILFAQRRLLAGAGGRRRGSRVQASRREWFRESLQLLRSVAAATGRHSEDLQRWENPKDG